MSIRVSPPPNHFFLRLFDYWKCVARREGGSLEDNVLCTSLAMWVCFLEPPVKGGNWLWKCPLASARVQGPCAPVPTYKHHVHTYTKIIMILNILTDLQTFEIFFPGRFVKLTPNLILTSLISTFNFSSLKFPETQSVTLSFRINLSQPGINWEKYFNGRIVWIKLTCGQVPEKPIWLLIGASELAVSSAFHSSGDPKCVRQDRARWRHGGRPHGCLFLSTPVHGCSVTSCLEFLLWQTAAWHSSRINAFPHKLLFCWDVLSQQQKIEPGHRLSSVLVHIMSVPVSAVFGKF